MEQWKDVNDYYGLYQVSDMGNIKSVKNGDKILTPTIRHGYLTINFYKNNQKKFHTIHSLVMATFLGPRNKKEIDHINKIRSDNRLVNLRYVTKSQNLCFIRPKSSKYAGVFLDKISGKWKSEIQINKTKKRIGTFKCETAAYFHYLLDYNKIYS